MRPESIVYLVFAGCFVAFGVGAAIQSEAAGSPYLGLLWLGATWSIAAFLGLRMARLDVIVEADGIRVRNPLKSEAVSWQDIRGFTLSRFAVGEFGIAELHDGRSIRLWGIQRGNRVTSPSGRRAELVIGTLNRELQAARGRGSLHRGRDERGARITRGAPSAERT
jgi:hypothetical protein